MDLCLPLHHIPSTAAMLLAQANTSVTPQAALATAQALEAITATTSALNPNLATQVNSILSKFPYELPVFPVSVIEPRHDRTYAVKQRLYVELALGNFTAELSMDACVHLDFDPRPVYCGTVLRSGSETMYFTQAQTVTMGTGVHSVTAKAKGGLAFTGFFYLANPSIEIVQVVPKIVSDFATIEVQLQISHYDASTPWHICLLVDAIPVCTIDSGDTVVLVDIMPGNRSIVPLILDVTTNKALHLGIPRMTTVPHLQSSPTNPFSVRFAHQRAEATRLNILTRSSCMHVPWFCHLPATEWGYTSQNGEDGVLLFLLTHVVKVPLVTFLEFGAENGYEVNTRFLRERLKATGVMFDGGYENESIGLHKAFVTSDNINDLMAKYGISDDLTVLSIDIDFQDWYVLKSILENGAVRPRIIVGEYNSHFSPNTKRIVQQNKTGIWDGKSNYFGASLTAFSDLLDSFDYKIVHCESHGVNFFAVAKELLGDNTGWDHSDVFMPPNFYNKGWKYPEPHERMQWVEL